LHELLDVRPWPRILLRHPLLIVTAFLLGGITAFAYSYAPLHRAKDWKISYLEERLSNRNTQVEELEAKLAETTSSLEGQPSNEELKGLEAKLAEADQLAKTRERQIDDLEAKLSSATRSRDSWKSRHAATLAELERLKSGSREPPSLAGAPPDDDRAMPASPAEPEASEPASPAPQAPGGDGDV